MAFSKAARSSSTLETRASPGVAGGRGGGPGGDGGPGGVGGDTGGDGGVGAGGADGGDGVQSPSGGWNGEGHGRGCMHGAPRQHTEPPLTQSAPEHMYGSVSGHLATPPWQSQQDSPKVSISQLWPSAHSATNGLSVVPCSHEQFSDDCARSVSERRAVM